MFGRIIKGIIDKYFDGNKHIQTLIVPGNHDNLVRNPDRKREEIIGFYKDKKTESHYYDDLVELDDFYSFANRNYCFSRNKNVEIRSLRFGSFTIKVNLINSAPFSLLGSENGDKGLHYLPSREISKFDFDKQENYTISIIHHGPEWFADETKKALYNKFYESTDLLFVGHEHFSLNETKTVNGRQIDVSSGVALYGTKTEHGFNALILDTNAVSLIGYKFIYNGRIYKPSKEPVIKNENIIFKGKYKFTHTPAYKKYLESDIEQREGDNYLDYFVFPSLEAKNLNSQLDTININTEEKFMEVFKANSQINIEGNLKSGKTTLAKYLCLVLADEYVPLLLSEESFGAKNNKNIIKYALEEQFGPDTDCDEYLQLDKEKKVLIVDRNDRVNKEKWDSFMPDKEEKKKNIEKKNEVEKTIVEEKQKNAESLYSYDESKVNSFSNKISKSLSYLELVAKILPNFRHILKGNEKKTVVEMLYTYPNKLLYFMLKDIDQNIDRLIDEILSKNPKTKRGMLITKDMLEKSLQTQAMVYILSIYDFVACTASAGKGMDELNKFSYDDNLNYILQNIMMEENNGNFYNFSTKAENLYDSVDSDMLKNMVAMVVRKYFLNHEIVLNGKAQHVADKFFGQDDMKKLQILQAKNRIVKK